MWIRWIGGRGWGDALLRWFTALLLPFAGLVALTEAALCYSLSTLSMDCLKWLFTELGLRGEVFMWAATLPDIALTLGLAIVMGAAIALLFRVQPLRIAAVAALVLPLLLIAGVVMEGDGIDAATWRLGLRVAVYSAGTLLPPWLAQRRRRPGESAALT